MATRRRTVSCGNTPSPDTASDCLVPKTCSIARRSSLDRLTGSSLGIRIATAHLPAVDECQRSRHEKGFNPEMDVDPPLGPLHKQLKGLVISREECSKTRHESVGLVKKVSWASYEKNRFEVLIDDVRVLVDDLIEMLLVRAVTTQRRIANLEVSSISDSAAVEVSMDIIDKDDPLLNEVARETIEERSGQVFKKNMTVGRARARMGDKYNKGWTRGAQGVFASAGT